jgi:CsoR family transcriptional regulator, copper-sensing transcriptional repressor
MQVETKQQVVQRLKSIQGHLAGVLNMVEDDRYCVDVLKQTKAIQRALAKVDALILENHLHTCVTTAMRGQDEDERSRVVGELVTVYDLASRIG